MPLGPIRFECQPGCTRCCDQQGFVYLTEDDITRLAAFLKLPRARFEKQYVFRTHNLRRLRVPRHAQCWFLKDGGCGVHPAKPLQCRTFPYWPEILASGRAWRATGMWCPGVGKGELVNIENAQAQAADMKSGHPALYEAT
jgi:uncharacterized protein